VIFSIHPGVVILTEKFFDATEPLRNQYVFLERGDILVVGEFHTSVVGFGGIGKKFENDPGGQEDIF
jgi:hypothetical protein